MPFTSTQHVFGKLHAGQKLGYYSFVIPFNSFLQ